MNEQDPKASKCWDCEFGHCMSQTQREILFTEMHEEVEEESEFDLGVPTFEEPIPVPIHQVEKHAVTSICYWTPRGTNPSRPSHIPPIIVQTVHECSRYKKRDD